MGSQVHRQRDQEGDESSQAPEEAMENVAAQLDDDPNAKQERKRCILDDKKG